MSDKQRYPFLHNRTLFVLVVDDYGVISAWADVAGTWIKQASIPEPVRIVTDADGRVSWIATVGRLDADSRVVDCDNIRTQQGSSDDESRRLGS